MRIRKWLGLESDNTIRMLCLPPAKIGADGREVVMHFLGVCRTRGAYFLDYWIVPGFHGFTLVSVFACVVNKRANFRGKSRQVLVNRFPHDLQIDNKVAVRNSIAHGVDQGPRDIRMA